MTLSEAKYSAATFDWLVGDWHRTNDQDDASQTYECWQKIDAQAYRGLGFIMQQQDTVWQENIKLHAEQNQWFFDVSGVNESTTRFTITEMNEASFTCTNPENEFPKFIKYQRNGKDLKAVIWGDGKEVEFLFAPLVKSP